MTSPRRNGRKKTTRSAGAPRPPRSGGAVSVRIPRARLGEPSQRHRRIISLIMVGVLLLSGRLIWGRGLDASARAEDAVAQRTVTRTSPALRGEITDRNGTVLASSVQRYDLWVNQMQVDEYLENSKTA